jgi:hypothetical protein
MTHRSIFPLATAALLTSAPAYAAPVADLAVSISPPAGVHVYETGHYDVTVSNVGNKNASSVSLLIQLPETNTSPNVYILGTLGARDARCSVAGTSLSCSLGTIARNASTTVYFEIALPYSSAPLVIDAGASTTTQESNLSNNDAQHVAAPLTYGVTMSPPEAAINRHCTGQGLTSFFECELFPSSISSHETIFEAGGSITFVDAPPTFTGTWTQVSADRLQFQYFDDGVLAASFDGRGVGGDCFEGPTTFPGSPYMSMYEVCLQ